MSDNEVTLGEIHRVLLRVEQEVKRTNGRVDNHDVKIAVIETKIDAQGASAKTAGRNWGAGAGAAIGGMISVLWQVWTSK